MSRRSSPPAFPVGLAPASAADSRCPAGPGAPILGIVITAPPLSHRAILAFDLPAIRRIEAASFPSAWSRRLLVQILSRPDTEGEVVLQGVRVRGFYVTARLAHHTHVLNLAVDRSTRRQGLASYALRRVERRARSRGHRFIELEVRETNLAAQLLYRKAGYRAIEIKRGYYGDEDGYLMRLLLDGGPAG